MKPKSGTTESLWAATSPLPEYRTLDADLSTEVCIVGGGIAGLTSAYLLAWGGKKVVLLEDGALCSGETHRTTAHLSNILDDRFQQLEKSIGKEKTRLAADTHTAAINRIEQIVLVEDIDCDFERVDGYLFLGPEQSNDLLVKELECATRAGIVGGAMLSTLPLGGKQNSPCILFPNQAQFHVLRYLRGLARVLERLGVKVYTGTHVTGVDDGPFVTVKTDQGHKVTAEQVVVATNSPVTDLVAMHTKQAPYRSYVIAMPVASDLVPKGLYWDMADPYHYCRLQKIDGNPSQQMLIIGGEDHKVGHADNGNERFAKLEAWARQWFPAGVGQVAFRWSGQVLEPVDGLAFIGRDPASKSGNVFIITGDSGMGMTHGTAGAMLVSDLIFKRDNPWTELYEPSRKMLHNIPEYLGENLSEAAYYARAMTPGDVKSVDEIKPGEGAVIRDGLKLVAVYKDESGNVKMLSPVCPHMKGIVCFNHLEKSWDCPVHGSRFDAEGKVIMGPANCDLTPGDNELSDKAGHAKSGKPMPSSTKEAEDHSKLRRNLESQETPWFELPGAGGENQTQIPPPSP